MKDQIIEMAKTNGWDLHPKQPQDCMIRFVKEGFMVDVWHSKMTVGTYLKHPKQGKTQLFRRNVSYALLNKIFKNPRIHTPKGYHTK